MFRMVKESLPNGQDSIPYLEKAVSEGWLEQEINMLLKNYYAFARGRKGDSIIYFSKLKSRWWMPWMGVSLIGTEPDWCSIGLIHCLMRSAWRIFACRPYMGCAENF